MELFVRDIWLWALNPRSSPCLPAACSHLFKVNTHLSETIILNCPAGWSREFNPERREDAADWGLHQPAEPAVPTSSPRRPSHHWGGGAQGRSWRGGGQGGWLGVSSWPAAQPRLQQWAQHLGVLAGVSWVVPHTFTHKHSFHSFTPSAKMKLDTSDSRKTHCGLGLWWLIQFRGSVNHVDNPSLHSSSTSWKGNTAWVVEAAVILASLHYIDNNLTTQNAKCTPCTSVTSVKDLEQPIFLNQLLIMSHQVWHDPTVFSPTEQFWLFHMRDVYI